MVTSPSRVGVSQVLACMLLVAVSALSFAETNYIAGLRQFSLLDAGNDLAEGDSQAQLRQLKVSTLRWSSKVASRPVGQTTAPWAKCHSL